LGRYLKVFMKK